MNSWRSRGGKAATPDRAGLSRVVFGVSDPHELSLLDQRLSDDGWPATIAAEQITLLDPDGIELQFQLIK